MRLTILFLSIICLFLCGLYENNPFTYRAPVKWNERNQLYASEFVALAKPYEEEKIYENVSIDSNKVIKDYAWISTTIQKEKISDTDISDIAIFAVFNPNKSYFFDNKDTFYRDLITHEEYHFHLAEAISRKARRELVQLGDLLDYETIYSVLYSHRSLLDSLNNAYDSFTNHGIKENKQIQYQSKIDSMLANYAAYSDPYIRNYKKDSSKPKNQLTGNSLYKTQIIRKDSLVITVRKDMIDTVNRNRYKFTALLAIENLKIKNGQLQRVKAFFINNGLFDPSEIGKTVSYSIQFKQNAPDEKPFEYVPIASLQDTAYISFIVNEDVKEFQIKEKYLSVKYNFNLNGKDTSFICSYNYFTVK